MFDGYICDVLALLTILTNPIKSIILSLMFVISCMKISA